MADEPSAKVLKFKDRSVYSWLRATHSRSPCWRVRLLRDYSDVKPSGLIKTPFTEAIGVAEALTMQAVAVEVAYNVSPDRKNTLKLLLPSTLVFVVFPSTVYCNIVLVVVPSLMAILPVLSVDDPLKQKVANIL